ncbi:MAG TPA: hypothetical protein VNV62_06730, partial [Trebonia sp.]|nr:hypothetical protein [Trebonia sp.]
MDGRPDAGRAERADGQPHRPDPNEQAGGQPHRFESPELIGRSLREAGYLANERISSVVYLGDRLGKPVL